MLESDSERQGAKASRGKRSEMAGESTDGARHLCRFIIRLSDGMACFQACSNSEIEAA
jgi:hypothetical protein